MEASLGLSPPAEARLWWEWHDGVVAEAGALSGEWEIGPGLELLSVTQAIAHYRQMRALAAQTAAVQDDHPLDDPGYWWDPAWLPLVRRGDGATITCDCSTDHEGPSPIRSIDWHEGDWQKPVASSLGEMIAWWVVALDSGAWRYNLGAGRWERDWQMIDVQRQAVV